MVPYWGVSCTYVDHRFQLGGQGGGSDSLTSNKCYGALSCSDVAAKISQPSQGRLGEARGERKEEVEGRRRGGEREGRGEREGGGGEGEGQGRGREEEREEERRGEGGGEGGKRGRGEERGGRGEGEGREWRGRRR